MIQALTAFSLGEFAFYASVKAAAETFGMLSILTDFGWKMHGGRVWGDANVALGIINRNGWGKTVICIQDFCAYNRSRQNRGSSFLRR